MSRLSEVCCPELVLNRKEPVFMPALSVAPELLVRIELTAIRLQNGRSTTELQKRVVVNHIIPVN